jgi:hypothetical protein
MQEGTEYQELDRAMEVVALEWASTCICSRTGKVEQARRSERKNGNG